MPALATAYIVLSSILTVLQRRFASSYRRDLRAWRRMSGSTEYCPSVDVMVPCYNEDPALLRQCLQSLALQRYKGELRVWIVDDGSSNRAALQPVYDGYATRDGWQVIVLPRNGGKRRAQDEVVSRSSGELVVTIDSDTVLRPVALESIVAPFRDERVGMATGNVRASNRRTNRLTRLIDTRYRILFNTERAAQSDFFSVLCCSGSFAVYRRSALQEVWPGYLGQRFPFRQLCTWGEDLHLTTQILAKGYRSLYEPRALAATAVPETLRAYLRQQLRWNRSFYRELLWIVPVLARRPAYLALEVAGRLFLPLLVPFGAALLVVTTILHPELAIQSTALLAAMLLTHLALAVWQTRRPWFCLQYGLIYLLMLIPVRLYAICTLTNTRWGTRWVGGDRAVPAQEIGSSLETQEWSESPPSTGMFTPVR